MKKILIWGLLGCLFLSSLGCVSYGTARRVNALYDQVNQMQLQLNRLEKRTEELNAKILELKGPPTAELRTLQEAVNKIEESYIHLARELAETQQKVGIPPMEVLPSKTK